MKGNPHPNHKVEKSNFKLFLRCKKFLHGYVLEMEKNTIDIHLVLNIDGNI